MKYLIISFFIVISCNKKYESPYGYNRIILYQYKGKPWDINGFNNKLYNGYCDKKSCINIEKFNYQLIKEISPNSKIDSLLFSNDYDEYRPRPACPLGYIYYFVLSDNSNPKYVVKLSWSCREGFIDDLSTSKSKYIRIGYDDLIKVASLHHHTKY